METKRIKKNKREQKRVKLLHNAFKELQELLPSPNYQKTACTKAQILKDASMYIRFLKLKLQNVEEKRTEDSSDNFQVRPSCVFATEGQEVSYLTHPEQSQSPVSFAASPPYYEDYQEIDCTHSLTAPIWSVSNISQSDTEHQLSEDQEYCFNKA